MCLAFPHRPVETRSPDGEQQRFMKSVVRMGVTDHALGLAVRDQPDQLIDSSPAGEADARDESMVEWPRPYPR